MKRFTLPAALFLSACATTDPGTPSSPVPPAAAPTTSAAASAAPASGPSKPSFKETQRLDRELGQAVVPYPFDHCAVIQKPFGSEGPKHRRVYQGQEVLFCCTPCVRAFDANPDPYMPRIVAAAQAARSPAPSPAP